jgi:hypothetical protein
MTNVINLRGDAFKAKDSNKKIRKDSIKSTLKEFIREYIKEDVDGIILLGIKHEGEKEQYLTYSSHLRFSEVAGMLEEAKQKLLQKQNN